MTTTKNKMITTKNNFETQTNLLLTGGKVDNIIRSKVDTVMTEHQEKLIDNRVKALGLLDHKTLTAEIQKQLQMAQTDNYIPPEDIAFFKENIINHRQRKH